MNLNKKLIIATSTLSLILAISTLSTMLPAVVANTENEVSFEVSHGYWLGTDGDTVTNVPYSRLDQWLFQIHNSEDATGQSMINPCIKVLTDMEFVRFGPWDPTISDGEYEWNFPLELPEGSLLPTEASEPNYIDYACPGFSAERSVYPETLVEPVTVQYLSLTFTLEDALPADVNSIGIELGVPNIIFSGEKLVDYTILSLNDVEDWSTGTESWAATPSDVSIGKTYHFEATLEAVKSSNLEGSPKAKPGILIISSHWDDLGNIGVGSSATAPHPEGPAVTVCADGEYEWYAAISYSRQDFWFSQVVSEVVENPDPPPLYSVKVPATIDIDPNTLQLKSNGAFVTAYIELSEGYDAANIGLTTVQVESIPAIKDIKYDFVTDPAQYLVDHDGDGIPERMVKFDRSEVATTLSPGTTVELTVTGELTDGTLFEGSDTIRVK